MKSPIPDHDIMTYCLHNIRNKVTECKNFIAIYLNKEIFNIEEVMRSFQVYLGLNKTWTIIGKTLNISVFKM